jgi:two-component system cell cycle response regulator
MQDPSHDGARKAAPDADATLVIPLAEDALATDRAPDRAAVRTDGRGHPRRDTPHVHTPLPLSGTSRATLTVLTGLHAGRLTAIDGAPVTVGRALDADLVVDDAGVSRHHLRITHMPAGGFCVEDLASTNGTFVGDARVGVAVLHRNDLLQLGPTARIRFAIIDSVAESLRRQLYESSVRDPLTLAFNRRYFVERLAAEIAHERRAQGDVAVLMIDVDSLKTINDLFGHIAGDRALCSVAARILRTLRVEDVLARYGGDEFVVLAAGTDRADAGQLAERIRRAVEGLCMSARGREVRITTSIGVASLAELSTGDEPVETLLAMADERMYGAKAAGKNKVLTTSGASSAPDR